MVTSVVWSINLDAVFVNVSGFDALVFDAQWNSLYKLPFAV